MEAKVYEVKLAVRRLEGWKVGVGESGKFSEFFVKFEWPSEEDSGLEKKQRNASTNKATLGEDGVVLWNDEFNNECRLADMSDDEESELKFKVFGTRTTQGAKRRLKIGTISIDLLQWASTKEGQELNLSLPLIQERHICDTDLLLCISLMFSKLEIHQQSPNAARSPSDSEISVSPPKITASSNELSEIKSVDKKIIVYTRRSKLMCHEKGGSNNGGGTERKMIKRKRSERTAIKRRKWPFQAIGIEDSEDKLKTSCQTLTDSEPLQLTRESIFSCNSVPGSAEDGVFVPQWQQINVVNRDAVLKLQTQALFASVDQRSEQAGGSSACSALVVVIADWLHANKGCLPDQCEFDCLIKKGSMAWRELQKNGGLMEAYADAHFDIQTVLHLRPICVDDAKSTIAFFQPDRLPDEVLNFLPDTSSFDDLWKEVNESKATVSDSDSLIYIVGWNDHFFLLKADSEAYYIIDTLGERLFEGCDQGYILKFDEKTEIYKYQPQAMENKSEILYSGLECCKHYFESFLAALPLNEAIKNYKKGMLTLDRLYGKLQIEFSYTKSSVH